MISLSSETIEPMLNIMDKHNSGEDIKSKLSELLDYEDYRIELERYKNHPTGDRFTKDEFIEFFLNIRNVNQKSVFSKYLRLRRTDLIYIMDNLDYYRNLYTKIKKFSNEDVGKALKITHNGLPDNIRISEMKLIFSIGLGMSSGWIYKGYSQYDLKNVLDTNNDMNLYNTIAHECHHMGLSILIKDIDFSELSKNLDAYLIFLLSGEGLAIKFCNNYEGKLTSRLYTNEISDCVKKSLDYYLKNFDTIYLSLIDDIKKIRNKEYSNLAEVRKLFHSHYFYTDVEKNGEVIENYLLQPITYFLGADLWGLIFDIYGKEIMFECLKNPTQFFTFYNLALIKIGKEELQI